MGGTEALEAAGPALLLCASPSSVWDGEGVENDVYGCCFFLFSFKIKGNVDEVMNLPFFFF